MTIMNDPQNNGLAEAGSRRDYFLRVKMRRFPVALALAISA